MHCQDCRCIVTQAEADEANEIHPSDLTMCPACAAAWLRADELEMRSREADDYHQTGEE